MKIFSTSSLIVAVAVAPIFVLNSEREASAQTTRHAPVVQPLQAGKTKLQRKQRDSGAARSSDSASGVQARRKSNTKGMTPDTSYNTITNTLPSTGRTGQVQNAPRKTALPESMRIQQETVRALPPRNELITKGSSSAPPSAVNSTVEQNRIDSAAPSRQRLQIDDLSAVRPQQPNSNTAATTFTGSPRNRAANGISTGTSGSSSTSRSLSSGLPSRSVSSSARSGARSGASRSSSSGGGR
jgi:hypothetical protein